MKRAFDLGPAVDGTSVDCPTGKRRKGLLCAKKARDGSWEGFSRRCHPARITAAIEARQARERVKL